MLEQLSNVKCFGGYQQQFRHQSTSNNCTMQFSIYLPPQANENNKVPVLYWLSGLTCTDENFVQKAGAQKIAAELGIAIVMPDTSPRGDNVADDPDKAYDLGLGAGFYLNAIQTPWQNHYHMYDYIVQELPAIIEQHFPVTTNKSISGHSMGGHGALTIALKNKTNYRSVSAFSPICNPMNVPWGQKAFNAYLGEDKNSWQQYDASYLMAQANCSDFCPPALVSQGSDDNFLQEQLSPECLVNAAEKSGYPLSYKLEQGYDHSYFFIASFIEQHLRFHAEHLVSNN